MATQTIATLSVENQTFYDRTLLERLLLLCLCNLGDFSLYFSIKNFATGPPINPPIMRPKVADAKPTLQAFFTPNDSKVEPKARE